MTKLKAFDRWQWLLMLQLLPLVATSQIRVNGLVENELNSSALEQVEVFVPELDQSKRTDQAGQFEFELPAPGTYTFILFAEGFASLQLPISLETSSDTTLRFTLAPLAVDLSAVVVRDQQERRFALERLRAVEGTAIYAGKKSEVILLDQLIANKAANQARQIYAQVAGLNIYEGDDAGLQLNIGGRGLDPNRTASFNTRQNGYDISADVLGYPESYYSPPAEALQRVEVVRGAASLQYGTQFGGFVNFVFNPPPADRAFTLLTRQTIGSNQLFTSFNRAAGTLGKFSYSAFYNRKQGDGFRPNSEFHSDNVFIHLGYAPTERTKIELEYTYLHSLAQQAGGLTDAQFYADPDFSNRTRNWFEVDWQLYALKVLHRFSPRTNVSLIAFGLNASRNALGFRTNRVSQTDDLNAPRDLIKGTFDNGGAELRLVHRYRVAGRSSVFLVGAKFYQAENTALQGPGSNSSDADFALQPDQFPDYPNQSNFEFPNRNVALFGEHIFYLTDRLSLTPGLRYEFIETRSQGTFRRIDFDLAGNPIRNETFADNRTFSRHLLLLGIGTSYKPTSEVEAYFNFSQNYRSVTFNDIRIVNPSFQIDPDISDERGFTTDLGIRGQGERISFDINGFALLYDDRLGEVLRPEQRINAEGQEVETGRILRFRGNIGRALIYGLESMVDFRIFSSAPNQTHQYVVSVFLNTSLTRSEYLESEIPGVAGKEVEFVPLVNIKTGIRFGYDNFLGSLQYTYLSDQFTDASNAPQDRRDNQSGIIGTIPAYGILDASFSYTFAPFQLEAGINNLLDNRYFTRRATGYPGPGIIPAPPRTFYLTAGFKF